MVPAYIEDLDDPLFGAGDGLIYHTLPGLDSRAESVDKKRWVLCVTPRVRFA